MGARWGRALRVNRREKTPFAGRVEAAGIEPASAASRLSIECVVPGYLVIRREVDPMTCPLGNP